MDAKMISQVQEATSTAASSFESVSRWATEQYSVFFSRVFFLKARLARNKYDKNHSTGLFKSPLLRVLAAQRIRSNAPPHRPCTESRSFRTVRLRSIEFLWGKGQLSAFKTLFREAAVRSAQHTSHGTPVATFDLVTYVARRSCLLITPIAKQQRKQQRWTAHLFSLLSPSLLLSCLSGALDVDARFEHAGGRLPFR